MPWAYHSFSVRTDFFPYPVSRQDDFILLAHKMQELHGDAGKNSNRGHFSH
jgi:hypothetical protein